MVIHMVYKRVKYDNSSLASLVTRIHISSRLISLNLQTEESQSRIDCIIR